MPALGDGRHAGVLLGTAGTALLQVLSPLFLDPTYASGLTSFMDLPKILLGLLLALYPLGLIIGSSVIGYQTCTVASRC